MSENTERNLLGDMLSIEFSECSIAAAEANRAAATHMQGWREARNLQLIGEGDTIDGTMAVVPIGHHDQVGLPGCNPAELVFVQPVEETHRPSFRRRLLLGKVIDLPTTATHRLAKDRDPMLVALLEDSIAVPIATFARRENGACSYVQIGPEITDDSLHATTADDQTSRREIIERIRFILTKSKFSYPEERAEELLAGLVQKELQRHPEQLARAYERYLVQRCFGAMKKGTETLPLVVAGEDGGGTGA